MRCFWPDLYPLTAALEQDSNLCYAWGDEGITSTGADLGQFLMPITNTVHATRDLLPTAQVSTDEYISSLNSILKNDIYTSSGHRNVYKVNVGSMDGIST